MCTSSRSHASLYSQTCSNGLGMRLVTHRHTLTLNWEWGQYFLVKVKILVKVNNCYSYTTRGIALHCGASMSKFVVQLLS